MKRTKAKAAKGKTAKRPAAKRPARKRPAKKRPARKRPAVRRGRPDAPHLRSATAVAAEAMQTGVMPAVRRRGEIPSEDEAIRVGDPDDIALENEYGGEDTPGGSSTTPDQNNVDEIGRVYGLQDEDNGPLRSAAEVLEGRDRRRTELRPPRRPRR
jgi:hypothetical protein